MIYGMLDKTNNKLERLHPWPSTTRVDTYDKIEMTIDSCTHWHQLAMIHKMIELYKKRYNDGAEDMSLIRHIGKKERFLLSDEDKVDMKVQIEDLLNSTDRLEIS